MNKIIHGDCLEVLKTIESDSVDLVIADPPFGLRKFGEWDKYDEEFNILWIAECIRVLKPDGQMYVFWGHKHLEEMLKVVKPDAIIHWQKPKPIINPKSRRWVASVEYIFWNRMSKEYTWNFPDKSVDLLNRFTDSLAMQAREKIYHRCQKPTSILNKLIERSSNAGDVVLDPFLGSGSTILAARALGRGYIGIELDKKFYDITKERIKESEADEAQGTML